MLKHVAGVLLTLCLLPGCDTAPKQKAPPRIPDPAEDSVMSDKGADMAAEPEEGPVPVEHKKLTPDEKRARCCQQCVKGFANDRTGDPPKKIPCQDFTVDVKKSCLKWFHDHPMNAAEAKSCAAETGGAAGAASAAPAASGAPAAKGP